MIISPYCGFFKEERDDEYAPPYDMCELCYRYDICKKAEIQEVKRMINTITSYKNKACEIASDDCNECEAMYKHNGKHYCSFDTVIRFIEWYDKYVREII